MTETDLSGDGPVAVLVEQLEGLFKLSNLKSKYKISHITILNNIGFKIFTCSSVSLRSGGSLAAAAAVADMAALMLLLLLLLS